MEFNLNKEITEKMKYFYEKERLASFNNWIFTDRDNCSVEKMAEAGFIYVGNEEEPDAVKCFFCEKHLDGWESTDDPWIEHSKHAPYCSFAKLQTPEDNLTLKILLSLEKEFKLKLIHSYIDSCLSRTAKTLKKLETKLKKLLC